MNIKEKTLMTSLLFLLFTLTPQANSQGRVAHSHTDSKNGRASPNRIASKSSQEFKSLDINRSGWIERDEIPAGHALEAHFEMLDSNKDGKLSKKEFSMAKDMGH